MVEKKPLRAHPLVQDWLIVGEWKILCSSPLASIDKEQRKKKKNKKTHLEFCGQRWLKGSDKSPSKRKHPSFLGELGELPT